MSLEHNLESSRDRCSPESRRRAMEGRTGKLGAGGWKTLEIYLSGPLHIRCFFYTVFILKLW